ASADGAQVDLAEAPTAGEVLFSDPLDDDQNGWAQGETEAARFSYEDGDFIWESKQENLRPHLLATTVGEAYDAGELDLRDVVVRADVTPVQGAAVAGVYCRETPDTDAEFQWYEFVVRDGYAAIRLADSEGELEVLAETDDLPLPIGEMFKMEAACVDDGDQAQLWLSVNGNVTLQATDDDPLEDGTAGLQAYDAPEAASAERFIIRWHEFTVFQAASRVR
ncbi:MAG: hypothetical protein H0T54_10075, partial [Geodermatophilaceae bacterium]|nr:hypothetical protein [Geodermatophilaceae bacterium]